MFGVSNLANLNFYTKMKATERLRDMLYSRACRFIACRICISAWAFSVAYLYRRAMREPDTEIGRSVILTPFLCLFSSCRGVARCRYDDTIGSLIEKKLREQGRTVTWFATALHCDRTNVYKIFQKSSIDSSMLYRISCILGYDFFSEYTQSFDKGVAKKSTKS